MINADELSLDALAHILDEAAIDYTLDDEGDIYVTDLHFNFWITVNAAKSRVQFTTYCDFKAGVAAEEARECANALNMEFIMTQFFVPAAGTRLRGAYTLLAQDGLCRRLFLRSARMFSRVFELAVNHPSSASLLDLPSVADREFPTEEEQAKLLN